MKNLFRRVSCLVFSSNLSFCAEFCWVVGAGGYFVSWPLMPCFVRFGFGKLSFAVAAFFCVWVCPANNSAGSQIRICQYSTIATRRSISLGS